MLVLLSLLAALGFAQDCNIPDDMNDSQKRRECKKRPTCKWQGKREDNGVTVEGTCAATTSCNALNANQCKKRNNCHINDNKNGKPCEDYNPGQSYPCGQLSGKKNMKKCANQPNCVNGSGDRQLKECLPIPTDIQTHQCSEYHEKPNKYLCLLIKKCTWESRLRQCVIKKKPEPVRCDLLTNRQECSANPNGCDWQGGQCRSLNCNQLTDRVKCNMSNQKCTWFEGFHATDFEVDKKKGDQRDDKKDVEGARDGTCKNGVSRCEDIYVEGHCLLSKVKHGVDGCFWNEEAKEMGRPRCSSRKPCGQNQGETECLRSNNMFNNACVWQLSENNDRCMEFACDDDRLDTKNKCNTVGCHWHRNKDKRDPESKGFCGILDHSKGRRRM